MLGSSSLSSPVGMSQEHPHLALAKPLREFGVYTHAQLPPYIPPYPFGLTPFRYSCLHPSQPAPPPGDPANPKFKAFDPYAYRSKEAIAAVREEANTPLSSDAEGPGSGNINVVHSTSGATSNFKSTDAASSQDQAGPSTGVPQNSQLSGQTQGSLDPFASISTAQGQDAATNPNPEAPHPFAGLDDPSRPLTASELETLQAVYGHAQTLDTTNSQSNQTGINADGVGGNDNDGDGDQNNPYDIFNETSQQALQSITALLEASGNGESMGFDMGDGDAGR